MPPIMPGTVGQLNMTMVSCFIGNFTTMTSITVNHTKNDAMEQITPMFLFIIDTSLLKSHN